MRRMRNAIVGLLIIIILGMASAAIWQTQEQPTQADRTKKTEECDPNQKDWKPIWERPSCFLERTALDPVATFTAALVVIAFMQAGLFVWQLGYMRAAMHDAKISADAATNAARAASEGNAINRQNMVESRRAWLSIENVMLFIESVTEVSISLMMDIKVKNVGDTPALNAAIIIDVVPMAGVSNRLDKIASDCLNKARSCNDAGGTTIFPNQIETFTFFQKSNADNGESFVLARDSPLQPSIGFPIGITYRIVGDYPRHVTYNCYGYVPLNIEDFLEQNTGVELGAGFWDRSEID